jgi:hypothetical protein
MATKAISVLTFCVCLGATSAVAQTRPLQTEEATTAPAGRIALEAGAAFMTAQPSFLSLQPRDVWNAPILNLIWSPAGNVEIDLEWVGRVVEVDDPTFGTASDYGDVTLRTKLRFIPEKGRRPAVGARFTITLPETNQDKGLGPNTNRMQAQALLTEVLGPVRLHANAGLAIHDQTFGAHAQHDLFAYGAAFEWSVTHRMAVLGEVAGRAGKGDPGVDKTHEARFGARFQTGRVAWDAAARRGLSDADGKWGFTAGLTWTAQAGR